MVQAEILKETKKVLPYIINMPSKHVWFDYDREADVAYISFEKPQKATNTEALDSGVLVRKHNNKIIGFTILNASRI